MNKKQYLMMCEQLGNEPIDSEIPMEYTDFPDIVQKAIMIYSILPDMLEGFSGAFLGKDYTLLPYLSKEVYNITDQATLMQILLLINNIVSKERETKRKQNERKSKGSKKGRP